jgi:hypothetical protein
MILLSALFKRLIDWLIYYLRFYVPLRNFSLIWRRHNCRWRAAKFTLMFGAQGLWAGRNLYRATPAVTRGLCFSGLIRKTAPFSRLLRHTRVCGGSIQTRILTGQKEIRMCMYHVTMSVIAYFSVTRITANICKIRLPAKKKKENKQLYSIFISIFLKLDVE